MDDNADPTSVARRTSIRAGNAEGSDLPNMSKTRTSTASLPLALSVVLVTLMLYGADLPNVTDAAGPPRSGHVQMTAVEVAPEPERQPEPASKPSFDDHGDGGSGSSEEIPWVPVLIGALVLGGAFVLWSRIT